MTFTLKLAKQLVCTTLRLVLYITVRGSGMLTDFCTYSLLCHGVPVSCQSAVSQLSGHRPFAIGNGHIHPAVTLSAQQQSSAKATLRRITLISHFPCYHGTLRITLISHFPCYHGTLRITLISHFPCYHGTLRITLISHFPCYHGTLRITLISHFPCYHGTLRITLISHFPCYHGTLRITLISHFPCYHGTLGITLISHFPCYHCTLGITDFTHFMVPLHTGAHWGTVKVKGPGSQRPDQVSGSRRSIRSDNLT